LFSIQICRKANSLELTLKKDAVSIPNANPLALKHPARFQKPVGIRDKKLNTYKVLKTLQEKQKI
jgi:hypothetical protein